MDAVMPDKDFLSGGVQSQLGATEDLEGSIGGEENGVGTGQRDFANDRSQVLVKVSEGTGNVISLEHRGIADTSGKEQIRKVPFFSVFLPVFCVRSQNYVPPLHVFHVEKVEKKCSKLL
jgi:hypothetical protein